MRKHIPTFIDSQFSPQESTESQSQLQKLQQALQKIDDALQHSARQHPYLTLGLAASAGFALGGGLSARAGSRLLRLGGKALSSLMVYQLKKTLSL